MGSTVSTNKQAYAFVTSTNRTAFVLFEQTYEKNCHPHTPDWSCVGLGYLDDMLQDVFRFASSCEGGMLQHRSGPVLPETYLQRWLETLAEPLAMHDVSGTVSYGESMYSTLPLNKKDAIEEALRKAGLESSIATLDGREVSLYRDFDLLRAIYRSNGFMPWRFIRHRPSGYVTERKDLGYVPAEKGRAPTDELPKMYRCGTESILCSQEKGHYQVEGWAYTVVGNYVRNYWVHERSNPGSFKAAFKRVRQAAETAPQVSDTARITLDMANATEHYPRRQMQEIMGSFQPGLERLVVTLAQVRQKEAERPDSCLLYKVLNCREAHWSSPAPRKQVEEVQLELLC